MIEVQYDFLRLNNKLLSEASEGLEKLLSSSCKELQQMLELDNCVFAVIGINNLLVQYQCQKEKTLELKNFFDQEPAVIKSLEKNQIYFADQFIFLPIFVYDNLVACQVLIKQKTQKYNEELLENHAHFLSALIEQVQTIQDLAQQNETLVQQDSNKTELLSTVSHELRTPMANILGFSEILLNKEFSKEESRNFIQEIHQAGTRLNKLIDNFLDLARLEDKKKLDASNWEEIELDWLAKNTWDNVRGPKKSPGITWDFGSNIPNIYGDQEALSRVLSNLFSNAIKYSHEQSQNIKCKIYTKDQDLICEVIDNGYGISEEEKEKIFAKFFRSKNPELKSITGTGLGLWIAQEIIKAHGGEIWCESKPGQGSKFAFKLKIGNNINNAYPLLN